MAFVRGRGALSGASRGGAGGVVAVGVAAGAAAAGCGVDSGASCAPNDTAISAGALAPTSIVWRRSPYCGCRNTTSRVPIGTVTSESGSAPMCSPSTHTSVPAVPRTRSSPEGSETVWVISCPGASDSVTSPR
jgi:hypothetical protein